MPFKPQPKNNHPTVTLGVPLTADLRARLINHAKNHGLTNSLSAPDDRALP